MTKKSADMRRSSAFSNQLQEETETSRISSSTLVQKNVPNIAVFASGNGSNFESIAKYFADPEQAGARVALLICNKPEAYVVERAKKHDVPVFCFRPKDYASKKDYEAHMLDQLGEYDIDFIALAGYMRLLGDTILRTYMGRIINIHPSLLPAFPGLDAVGQALEYGVRISGVTIHFVDEGIDTGAIIYQEAVSVSLQETKQSLAEKIHAIEHHAYPKIVQECVRGNIRLEGGNVRWETQSNGH